MAYFPMFVDLENKRCAVFGGGAIAFRKVCALLEFGADVTVMSEEFCQELLRLAEEWGETNAAGLHLKRSSIEPSLCDGFFLVVAATDDGALNHHIAKECKGKGIPVNAVDKKEDCTFIFPSYVKEQNLVAAFSSGGNSPLLTQVLKKMEYPVLTPMLGELNERFGEIRQEMAVRYADMGERRAAYERLFRKALKEDIVPEADTLLLWDEKEDGIYKIGSRSSKLAMEQAKIVADTLSSAYPRDVFTIVPYKTTGDKDRTTPIDAFVSKGVFVDAIEEALLAGEIDIAVHSMKDMPDAPRNGLIFARMWKREDPRDVLVVRGDLMEDIRSCMEDGTGEMDAKALLSYLPSHPRIATGSKRRSLQLLAMREDCEICPIRGNIDTRLKKLNEGVPGERPLDAIVVAAAGLKRLGLEDAIGGYFSPEDMVPSPAQGTLAIELRGDDDQLLERLNQFSDAAADFATRVERGFLTAAGGDCHLPIGAYCKPGEAGGETLLWALFGDEKGTDVRTAKVCGVTPEELIQKALKELGMEWER